MRKLSLTLVAVCVLFTIAAANTPLTGDEILPVGPVAIHNPDPYWGLDFIGSPEPFGTTWYDYQHNGSMTRMIAYGPDGSIHCAWMNGLVSGGTQRAVYYNKRLPNGTWQYGATGMQVSTLNGSGYCTLDLDPSGNPVIAYHGPSPNNIVYVWNSTGEHACLPSPVANPLVWPHVAVDSRGWIHIVAQTNPVGTLYYTRSENGGISWTNWVEVAQLGTAASVSQTITADPVSGKVAIAYTKPISTNNFQEDVYFVESTDGQTWNFPGATNITNFPTTSDRFAYCDVGLLYDAGGNLHIVYTTISSVTTNRGGVIYHWSQATGTQLVTGTFTESSTVAFNNPGAWRRCIDRPTLGQDAAGDLFCQWGQCTTPGDASAAGYGNWDVYATYSEDNGVNWMAPVNVTDTHSPQAPPGSCLSENWANMAKKVTDKLHIQYIKDLDAGGIPQTEGTWTLNDVVYQGVPKDSIRTQLTITLTPINPPIIIPPNGGSFNYNAQINNAGPRPLTFDVWIQAQLPNGAIYPILSRLGITLPAGFALTRAMTQSVPGFAPAGNYTMWGHAGVYNENVWTSSSFPFSKSGSDGSAGGDWTCSGWDLTPQEMLEVEAQPESHLLAAAYPNPFNPTTMLSYTLPQAADVRVSIYNVNGAEVATLVNGWRDAGTHQVVFDGSNLASGVYLYRVEAAAMSLSGKVVLLK
jgi:hypothetical protein